MRETVMTGEPITTGALSAAGYKFLAFLVGPTLATIVVMSLVRPQSHLEWVVALICTVVGSIGGGGAVVMYFGLTEWLTEPFGIFALIGFCFFCGLPAWVGVRWYFRWVLKNPDQNPLNPLKDMKDGFR